ncbi:MAG TPA: hypothetical protein VG013_00955 [Gemmataceae bacterium]|nr:hypothetical protein [Gemmataceae bacterium]
MFDKFPCPKCDRVLEKSGEASVGGHPPGRLLNSTARGDDPYSVRAADCRC